MRRDTDAHGIGHRRNLARFAEAADVAKVGLRDIDRPQPEQIVELLAVHEPLSGGDGYRRFVLYQLHAWRIAGLNRLFDEERPMRRKRGDVLQRNAGGSRPPVKVDHDLDVVADRFAQRAHHLGQAIELLGEAV
jgi:hypothetical protein